MKTDNTIYTLSRVFNILANYMDNYSGDLFLDFPSACHHYEVGEWDYPIVFVHKTHADLIDRYEDVCVENGIEPTFENSVKKCQETLGLDVSIEITPYKVTIVNFNVEKWNMHSIVSRLHDIENFQKEDAVEVIDKTNSKND